jgi:hypothetical protein
MYYKFLVALSLCLMLVSGFIHAFVDYFDGCFLEMVSNLSGWLGSFLLGYCAPSFKPSTFWFFPAVGAGIIGFWVFGYASFLLIAYLF